LVVRNRGIHFVSVCCSRADASEQRERCPRSGDPRGKREAGRECEAGRKRSGRCFGASRRSDHARSERSGGDADGGIDSASDDTGPLGNQYDGGSRRARRWLDIRRSLA
jgi:hypothetical protein